MLSIDHVVLGGSVEMVQEREEIGMRHLQLSSFMSARVCSQLTTKARRNRRRSFIFRSCIFWSSSFSVPVSVYRAIINLATGLLSAFVSATP